MKLKIILEKFIDLVLKYEWVVLVILLYPILFPRPEMTPVMLVIPLIWYLHWRSGNGFLPRTPLNLPLLILVVMLAVSLWATFSIEFSLAKISGLIFALSVFFATVRYSKNDLSTTLIFFLACGIALGGLGVLATNWSAKLPFLDRIMNRLPQVITRLPAAELGVHPNELGGLLILFVPLAITMTWRLLAVGRFRIRFLLLLSAGSALGLGALTIITQSRSALMGLGASIGFLLLNAGRIGKMLFSVCVILIIAILVWQGPEILLGRAEPSELETEFLGEITFDSRLEIWSRAMYGLQDFSFTGMGLGTFRRVAPVLYPFFLVAPDRDVAHAHNFFLQTGLDIGFPGLVSILAIYIGCFVMLYGSTQANNKTSVLGELTLSDISIGLAASLLAHFMYGLTDAVALGARPGFLLWMAFGLATGIYLRSNQESGIRYRDVGRDWRMEAE